MRIAIRRPAVLSAQHTEKDGLRILQQRTVYHTTAESNSISSDNSQIIQNTARIRRGKPDGSGAELFIQSF